LQTLCLLSEITCVYLKNKTVGKLLESEWRAKASATVSDDFSIFVVLRVNLQTINNCSLFIGFTPSVELDGDEWLAVDLDRCRPDHLFSSLKRHSG